MKWRHDYFVPLTIDDYLDGCDENLFPSENHGDASFTGVWTSSRGFLSWLEQHWDDIITPTLPSAKGCSILELGSGTGFLGIHLAYNLQRQNQMAQTKYDYKVTLSDTATTGAYFWTKANLERAMKQPGDDDSIEDNDYVCDDTNSRQEDEKKDEDSSVNLASNMAPLGNINVIPFDWSCDEQRQAVSTQMDNWDLIIGTDLIYSEDGCVYLVKAMSMLLISSQKERRILYGHTTGRITGLDKKFESELDHEGLSWKILERIKLPMWGDERITSVYDIRGI